MSGPRIVAADDNQEALFALETLLQQAGYDVRTASDGAKAIEAAKDFSPDLFLLDVMMPNMTGLVALERIRTSKGFGNTPVILLTSMDDLEDIRKGLNSGATDYISKPYVSEELLLRIETALRAKGGDASESLSYGMIGESDQMREVLAFVDRLRASDVPVLINGETGTGKELVARAIHDSSQRATSAFVPINCSAFAENLLESELFGHVRGAFTGAAKDKQGLFEVANEGTLFLDELGEMPMALQAKLLRVLEDGTFLPIGGTQQKKVDVRIVAATHKNLPSAIEDGKFREDLFYRLNVARIELSPLRSRVVDIPILAEHYLAQQEASVSRRISAEALRFLVEYRWPGNIRELKNEISRMCLSAGEDPILLPHHLSSEVRLAGEQASASRAGQTDDVSVSPGGTLKDAVQQLERKMIVASLARNEGNKSEAARELDISRSSLITKVKQYAIE